jgi:hypothetical protein
VGLGRGTSLNVPPRVAFNFVHLFFAHGGVATGGINLKNRNIGFTKSLMGWGNSRFARRKTARA